MKQLTHIAPSRERDRAPAPPKPGAPPLDESELTGAFQPCAPSALVRIYTLEREWGADFWLCPAAVDVMKADRWTVRKHRAPPFPDLPCYVHGDACPVPR